MGNKLIIKKSNSPVYLIGGDVVAGGLCGPLSVLNAGSEIMVLERVDLERADKSRVCFLDTFRLIHPGEEVVVYKDSRLCVDSEEKLITDFLASSEPKTDATFTVGFWYGSNGEDKIESEVTAIYRYGGGGIDIALK